MSAGKQVFKSYIKTQECVILIPKMVGFHDSRAAQQLKIGLFTKETGAVPKNQGPKIFMRIWSKYFIRFCLRLRFCEKLEIWDGWRALRDGKRHDHIARLALWGLLLPFGGLFLLEGSALKKEKKSLYNQIFEIRGEVEQAEKVKICMEQLQEHSKELTQRKNQDVSVSNFHGIKEVPSN